jgi:hypothetical protein
VTVSDQFACAKPRLTLLLVVVDELDMCFNSPPIHLTVGEELDSVETTPRDRYLVLRKGDTFFSELTSHRSSLPRAQHQLTYSCRKHRLRRVSHRRVGGNPCLSFCSASSCSMLISPPSL